jgi:hypothetical protein
MKIEAAATSSKTLVTYSNATQCHNPEDLNLGKEALNLE